MIFHKKVLVLVCYAINLTLNIVKFILNHKNLVYLRFEKIFNKFEQLIIITLWRHYLTHYSR